ncbi:hypothetical protein KP509_38G047000 [Ceratopteris richardii]|uniref:Factor of DNA methylation 1-5/IDN2 domain-containing protein n=1 Tax=Ceratopteris richardii TaxID=49495 RepID=A0A8T2Q4H5_CERRI|nr:hypothetical protein KP509_38G047000 [Ceratopteris richardii]
MKRSSYAEISVKFPQKCPFCPNQSRRMFDEIGLFQHAIAVSRCNPNVLVVNSHIALLNDLRAVMNKNLQTQNAFQSRSNSKSDSVERKNQTPHSQGTHNIMGEPSTGIKHLRQSNQSNEVKVVWPWMGILMNVDHKELFGCGNNVNAKENDLNANCIDKFWNLDLKSHFSHLNPRSIHPLWNRGLLILDFGGDLLGLLDAENFAKTFIQRGKGKANFNAVEGPARKEEMFGWIADEDDYKLCNDVGEFLRKRGTLRVLPHPSHSWSEQHDHIFRLLQTRIQEKNGKLIELLNQVFDLERRVWHAENERVLAESNTLLKELKNKQVLHTIYENAEKIMKKSKDDLLEEKDKLNSLQTELNDLKKKSSILEEKGVQDSSDDTIIQQLIDAVEEKEGLQHMVEKLIYKEREANDRIQNALKVSVEVLKIKGNHESIGLKQVGALNDKPWLMACQILFKDHEDGWQVRCKELMSRWENELRDPSWYPFKVMKIDDGKHETF